MIRSSKIRTLSAVAFAILLPVVAQATTTTAATTHKTRAHVAAASKKAARMPAVDINSASKEDLMKLNGITDETAEKIIAGRPYKSKTELTKKNILTKAEYAKVRSHVIAKQEKTAAKEGSAKEEAKETKAQEQQENKTAPETGK